MNFYTMYARLLTHYFLWMRWWHFGILQIWQSMLHFVFLIFIPFRYWTWCVFVWFLLYRHHIMWTWTTRENERNNPFQYFEVQCKHLMRNGIAFYHMHEGMNNERMRSLVLILYTNMPLKGVHLEIKYFLRLVNMLLSML